MILVVLAGANQNFAAPQRYAAQLARECDDLISLAIHRPYGVGWAENGPQVKPKAGAQPVTFTPPGTAAAGFVLYWSGDLLDNARYKEAGYDAARGMAAAHLPTGQIPANPLFLPGSTGGHDAPNLVADRAPSRAALGLILTLLDDTGGKDEQLRRSASPILTWLLKQQTATGAWPQGYPPTTAPKDAWRVTRLDTPDYRDSVFATLLAADVLNDTRARLSVERAIHNLLRMRIGGASRLGDPLWASVYGLDTFPTDRVPELPPGVDMLASRNAMQILLAAYVMLGDAPIRDEEKATWSKPLAQAAIAAANLPKFDGKWIRIYDYDVPATLPPPSTQPSGFETTAPIIPPSQRAGTWGLETLIEDAQNLADAGREKFTAALSANFTIHQRLAAALCGLDDDPFSVELPVLNEDIAGYLKDHEAKFRPLDDPMPASLNERVRRIYLLLIRAKLERRVTGRP